MDRLIEFSTNHPFLVLALFVVVGLLVGTELRKRTRGFADVTPLEATELQNRQEALMLDVREMGEYSQGHIIDALHIPRSALPERIRELDKHRGKPIIAYCANGNRSVAACSALKREGHEAVYNLGGGINAWQNANLPVTRK